MNLNQLMQRRENVCLSVNKTEASSVIHEIKAIMLLENTQVEREVCKFSQVWPFTVSGFDPYCSQIPLKMGNF